MARLNRLSLAVLCSVAVPLSGALAEGCNSAPQPQQKSAGSEKGSSAAVGNDGVGGTGWTGGTGGLQAGLEHQKNNGAAGADNPDVVKGLNPSPGTQKQADGASKC